MAETSVLYGRHNLPHPIRFGLISPRPPCPQLSTPMDNSEATMKKSNKMQQIAYTGSEFKVKYLKSGTKGQLISECLFDVLNFPKHRRKIRQISALESKKWSNHKIKAH